MFEANPPRRRLLVVLVAVAAASWAAVLVAVASRPRSSPRVHASPIQSDVTYVTLGRRNLSGISSSVVLHRQAFVLRAGPVTVRWYDSDFESLFPHTVALASLYVDGRRLAATVKSAFSGVYEDGPAELIWRGTLRRGKHDFEVRFASDAPWGVPYTDPGRQAVDELTLDADQSHG